LENSAAFLSYARLVFLGLFSNPSWRLLEGN
jgi:hypothetical protein